jgi:hypothetical protein
MDLLWGRPRYSWTCPSTNLRQEKHRKLAAYREIEKTPQLAMKTGKSETFGSVMPNISLYEAYKTNTFLSGTALRAP